MERAQWRRHVDNHLLSGVLDWENWLANQKRRDCRVYIRNGRKSLGRTVSNNITTVYLEGMTKS